MVLAFAKDRGTCLTRLLLSEARERNCHDYLVDDVAAVPEHECGAAAVHEDVSSWKLVA